MGASQTWLVHVYLRQESVVYVSAVTREEAMKKAREFDDVIDVIDADRQIKEDGDE